MGKQRNTHSMRQSWHFMVGDSRRSLPLHPCSNPTGLPPISPPQINPPSTSQISPPPTQMLWTREVWNSACNYPRSQCPMEKQLLDIFTMGWAHSPLVCQAASPSLPPLSSQPSIWSSKFRFPEHRGTQWLHPVSWSTCHKAHLWANFLESLKCTGPWPLLFVKSQHSNTGPHKHSLGARKAGLRRQYPRASLKTPSTLLEQASHAYLAYNSKLNQDVNLSWLKLQD